MHENYSLFKLYSIMMLQVKCVLRSTLVGVIIFWTISRSAESNRIKSVLYRFALAHHKKYGGGATPDVEKAVAGIIDCNRLCKLLAYSASEYKDGNCKLFTDQPTSYEDDHGSSCSQLLGKLYLTYSTLKYTHC